MRASRPLLVLAVAAVLLALALVAAPGRSLEASSAASDAAIRNAIDAVVSNDRLPDAFWGIYVQNLKTGEVVYSQNADKNLMPASNLKLVTTATALDALGADHRFVTGLYFDGTASDSTLRGDLVLRGSGDPTFGSQLYPPDPLRAWARQLRAMGVTRIEGRIIGDDDAVDDLPYADGWDISYIATEDWAQSVGGLSYADNLVTLKIAGTQPGEPATITPDPAGYVDVRNDLTTSRRRGYNPIRIRRTVGTNQIHIEGSVSAGYEGAARIPIQDPTGFTLNAFADRLREAGITVAAEIRDADDLEEPPSYDDAPIFVHLSPPLLEILKAINFKSNNLFAEQLFRTFSRNGLPIGGEQRVIEFLEKAGVETTGISIRDGSGLSRKNLISPETMGEMLAYVYRSPMRDAYVSTLARGGQEETTLRYRLAGLPVRAKTGAIEHVRTLSGYVAGPDETPYVFVVFANNFTSRSSLVSLAENEVVMAIASGGR
ncbi:MAG: D-alanyl-D-alanine carboxypeptidase/D-alanyl-D-alanine-endopeptidase [Rhodothermales bacterium]